MSVVAGLFAEGGPWQGHMGWGGGWWMLIAGPVVMLAIGLLVIWMLRATGANASPGAGPSRTDSREGARQILAERYARGDLDSAEYQERVDTLR